MPHNWSLVSQGQNTVGQIEQQIDIRKTMNDSEWNKYKQDEVLVDWRTKRNNKIMKSEDLKVSHSDWHEKFGSQQYSNFCQKL